MRVEQSRKLFFLEACTQEPLGMGRKKSPK